ncbi:MAG: trigger factor [Sulfurimonas sp.]|nr:trigger factor [Sulfurimonas sp.]MDQ7060333.1 trigger factor [Sulfurimonas sp.]
MKVTVKKVDDINYIISGSVKNDLIQEKATELQELAKKQENDASTEESIQQDASDKVFKAFVEAGIKEANIDVANVLGQPLLKSHKQSEDSIHFEVEISTSPAIDTDISYADIIPKFTKPVASAEDIEVKLIEYATQQALFTKIEKERPVENGDVAVIDFVGYIDGKVFEGGSAERFNLKVGSKSFIEGFEEQLIGMKYNETKSILVTFPKDYDAADLAGKETKFDVKLHEIQEQKPKTPDDAFAQKVLQNPKATLQMLKKQLGEQLTAEELSDLYMRELKPQLVKGLLTKFDFTLPSNIVEQEIDAKAREKTKSFTEEQHKEYFEDKAKFNALRESVREDARDSIKAVLIVEALAKKEGIVVHDQEVLAALTYQATATGQDAEKLVKYYQDNNLMTSAKMGLTEDKLFGVILGFSKH